MSRRIGIVTVIVAGMLWGLSEVFLGDVFYRFHIPMRAASLTAIGMTILVLSRFVVDRAGSSLAVAVIAGAMRCLVPKLYICHLIALALQGCAFDISWTALKAGERRSLRRVWFSSAIAAYAAFLSFGLTAAYAFGFGRWAQGGFAGVLSFTFRSGTFASLLLVGLVPLAAVVAKRLLIPAAGIDQEKVSTGWNIDLR